MLLNILLKHCFLNRNQFFSFLLLITFLINCITNRVYAKD